MFLAVDIFFYRKDEETFNKETELSEIIETVLNHVPALFSPPQSITPLLKNLLSKLYQILIFSHQDEDLTGTLADHNILIKKERVRDEGEDWNTLENENGADADFNRVLLLSGNEKDISNIQVNFKVHNLNPTNDIVGKYFYQTCQI